MRVIPRFSCFNVEDMIDQRTQMYEVLSTDTLRPAEHIAIKRYKGLYWHHLIVSDVINHKEIDVIHLSGVAGVQSKRNALVKKEVVDVKKYIDDGDLYRVPHSKARPASVVLREATRMIGEGGYELFSNNCEHFVNWCKTVASHAHKHMKR